MISKPLPPNPRLAALLEAARNAPPMTASELREQRISWAYGNCALANPSITREMVERIHDEMYGTITTPC
jgi:hypothetical protein